MGLYLLSYDLRQPGQNYQSLYDMLAKVDCVRALESVWLLDVNQTSAEIRDNVRSHLDPNDGVLVIQITATAGWAFVKLNGNAAAWLKAKRS